MSLVDVFSASASHACTTDGACRVQVGGCQVGRRAGRVGTGWYIRLGTGGYT